MNKRLSYVRICVSNSGSIVLIETIVVNYGRSFKPLVGHEGLLIFLAETASRLHSESDKSH